MNEAAPRLARGIGTDGTYTRGGQAAAFLFGLLTMLVFFPLLFVGALLYARAEERFPEDPARARKLVNWSWLSITAGPLVGLVVIAAVMGVRAAG